MEESNRKSRSCRCILLRDHQESKDRRIRRIAEKQQQLPRYDRGRYDGASDREDE